MKPNDQIIINTELVGQACENIETINNSILTELTKLQKSELEELCISWIGPNSRHVEHILTETIDKIAIEHEKIQQFKRSVYSFATLGYDEVERENKCLADAFK